MSVESFEKPDASTVSTVSAEDLVRKVVLAARGSQADAEEVERLKREKEVAVRAAKQAAYIEKQKADFLKDDNAAGYAGFRKDWDDKASEILGLAGVATGTDRIIVFPDATNLGKGNAALTLLAVDKVQMIEETVISYHNPDKFKAPEPVCYAKLFQRITVGTIVVSAGELGDLDRAKAIIWHESGHQSLGHVRETGAVFVIELDLIARHLGTPFVRNWILNVRTPEYFLNYGLKIEPGCRELVLELQKHLLKEDFDKYFQTVFAELTGPKEEKKDDEHAQTVTGVKESGKVWIGTVKGKNIFALTAEGPFIYATLRAADDDRRLVENVLSKAKSAFPQADPETLHKLVLEHILKTAKKAQ